MDPLTVAAIIIIILLIPTAYAAYIGAPYAPTKSSTIQQAFQHINLGQADYLVDLGAGDGRALLLASNYQAKSLGFELSPIMWAVTWLRLKFSPLGHGGVRARIKFSNFYRRALPQETTVVFAFLMPKIMPRVLQYLRGQYLPNARCILVYAFPFPDVKPRHVIREPKSLPLYIYDWQALK